MISLPELREAHAEGAGFCLFCATRNEDLTSPYASECESCGHQMVVPAATILIFLEWVDFGDEE
jgi:hypothetical protein